MRNNVTQLLPKKGDHLSEENFKFLFRLTLVLFISFSIGLTQSLMAQEQAASKYEWFDSLIGVTNSGVFEGETYYDAYNVRNNRHQFFESPRFQNGSAVYKGEMYTNLNLKYDIFNDKLIIRNNDVYWVPPMIFDTGLLSKFSIGSNEFVNFKEFNSDAATGFFEIILRSNSYSLLKKHKKKLFTKTEDEILYHEFKDDYSYYLQKEETYYRLRTAKDLNSIYPDHKKLIKLLEKRYNTIRKSDFDGYLKSILNDLQKELATTNEAQR